MDVVIDARTNDKTRTEKMIRRLGLRVKSPDPDSMPLAGHFRNGPEDMKTPFRPTLFSFRQFFSSNRGGSPIDHQSCEAPGTSASALKKGSLK